MCCCKLTHRQQQLLTQNFIQRSSSKAKTSTQSTDAIVTIEKVLLSFPKKSILLHRLITNLIKTWRLSRYTLLQRIKEIYQAQLVIFNKNWKKCSFSRNGQSPITQRPLQLLLQNYR